MTEPETQPNAPERRPFGAWLQEQRSGGLHGELSDALNELALAVMEHQKQGKLSLTITLTPNEDGVSLQVGDQVKLAMPEPTRPKSLFFTDSRGNLSRRDPRQAELPLRDASVPSEEPRDIRKAS